MKFHINVLYFYSLLLVFIFPLAGHTQDLSNYTTHPVQALSVGGSPANLTLRQQVDINTDEQLKSLWVYLNYEGAESFIPEGEWIAPELPDIGMEKGYEQQLIVFYRDKVIFDSNDVKYDYIQFVDVCNSPNNRPYLKFSMLISGTANADISDILFIYFDEKEKQFHYKIIEEKYLLSDCDLNDAIQNKKNVIGLRKQSQKIFE